MSDIADAPGDASGDAEEGAATDPPTVATRLLVLQAIDTGSDQLNTRLGRLDERTVQAEQASVVVGWERTLAAGEQRIDELAALIEQAERTGVEHEAHKERFEQQLKTIIAPREAEALMHEIETLDAERDTNETAELEALEEQSSLEEALVAHRSAEQGHRDALDAADRALAAVVAEIAAAQDDADIRRQTERAELDANSLRNYDRIRAQLGVAVATLEGKMCAGCHLDLSAAEIDTVRETAIAEDGLSDCPHCGRILVP